MTVSLKYVSSPVAVTPQSFYSAASTGFTTYAARGDGTQPPGTGFRQSVALRASTTNIVDVNACPWLAGYITAHAADPLLSQIAIDAAVTHHNPADVIPVITG